MDREGLREKLTNMGMAACVDCSYDCEPPRRQMLCHNDVDQMLILIDEAVKEEREGMIQAVIDWLQGDIDNIDSRTAGLPMLKEAEKATLIITVNRLKEWQALKEQ